MVGELPSPTVLMSVFMLGNAFSKCVPPEPRPTFGVLPVSSQRGQIGRRIVDGRGVGGRAVDGARQRKISNQVFERTDRARSGIAGKRSSSCWPSRTIRLDAVHGLRGVQGHAAADRVGIRNWMQASVPAVGQDVTGVRLLGRLLELPVISEFAVPGVSAEVTLGSIAAGNC